MSPTEIGKVAKKASIELKAASASDRTSALEEMANKLIEKQDEIIKANALDIEQAKQDNLSSAMIDRLLLTKDRIEQMALSVKEVAMGENLVGLEISSFSRADNLKIKKQLVPIGVIAMIFESRPNVVVDCSALAIKSGNSIILKGGKEAFHSNKFLGELIRETIAQYIPKDCVQVLDSKDRSLVDPLLTMNQYVNLIIPRGGEKLIEYVTQNATVPVIAHFKGLCHLYIHEDADPEKAVNIALNAKASRPGVCNAVETIILHKNFNEGNFDSLITQLEEQKIEVRGDNVLQVKYPQINLATEADWMTEYLDRIVSIKVVEDHQEAIDHIHQYGTNHTEGIVAKNHEVIEDFIGQVDASCVAVNSSTRFNDGGQLGLGAEIGISTTKLHTYGPMGVAELLIARYVVEGDGHIRN